MTDISFRHSPQQLGRKSSHFREDIIGPYSIWPRTKANRASGKLGAATAITAIAIITHCLVPTIF